MTTRITEQDLKHLRTFPPTKKAQIMQHVASESVTQTTTHAGSNHYERAILRLRQEGYSLIDVQTMETAFTMMWYRRPNTLFGLGKSGYAVLVLWEYEIDENTDVTTLHTWKM